MNVTGELVLRGVVKNYGSQRVVDDVSFTVASGEFFSLLGPSGSGKTTTLMMIAGFASIDGGELLLDGKDISAMSPQQRGLGMVFQNYALFPHMNVFENVAFPLRVRRTANKELEKRARWALEVVKLAEFRNRLPRELSGGQQQRVALARAIVFHPKVILMDEPLGALDKNLRYHMQVEIKEIQRQLGMTVVYVTHDQEEAMNMSDRIAIMNRGRIEQMGDPRSVYEKPANPFAAKFLGEANLLSGETLNKPAISSRYGEELASAVAPQLFIRPERIAICPENHASKFEHRVGVYGEVRRVSFLGNVVRHSVQVGTTESVVVDAQNDHADRIFDEGSRVYLHWERNDARILGHG